MFTPSSMELSGSSTVIYPIGSTDDLINHFQTCSRRQISRRLDLSSCPDAKPTWSFFFYLGRLVGCAGELHSQRRWYRQLLQYCPQLAGGLSSQDVSYVRCWNDRSIASLVQQGQIQQSHLSAIVAGSLLEVLFDVIQAAHLSPQPIKMHLTYQPLAAPPADSPWLVSFEAERIWQQAAQAWSVWQQSGLERISPNLAPVIWDREGLRQQTSLLTYHNLTAFATGYWALRDLAIKLKQPLVPLTRSLMPYVKQGIMGLNPVGDLRVSEQSSRRFLIAYVEDSGFDSTAMSQILDQAGHRFISIPDPLQAIPILLEQKPDLIFLDLLMPIANGYEVCTQIRRITAFKDVPIVILTSSDGIVDRVRAKLAGASGFLSKPIEQDKVLNTLRQHLPGFASP